MLRSYITALFIMLLLLVVGLLAVLYLYIFKYKYEFWNKRKVAGPTPTFPFGNFKEIFLKRTGVFGPVTSFYRKYKAEGKKYIGIYLFFKPVFVPVDLELVKSILIKDHANFVDRGVYYNEKEDPLSAHLFAIEGNKWQVLRAKLSPTFTSGKIKLMFSTIEKVGIVMENELMSLAKKGEAIEVKEMLARFSTDIIGSCAFGLECNSFADPNSEFRNKGRKIFEGDFKKLFLRFIVSANHKLAKRLNIKFTSNDMTNFFMGVVKDTVKYREANNVDRNDFMKLLIDLKNGGSTLGNLTIEEIAAQAFVFFLAGFETSSTTMNFCLYELAKNHSLQEQVRSEIRSVLKKHDDKLTYEAVKDMKLLQSAVDETLRMYPPVAQLNRICTKRYQVPDSDLVLEKGQSVNIPVYGIHHDPEFYPNPEYFDVTRFSDERKASIPSCAYLPFGEGPRNCIGLRFGLLQTKVGLISVLKNLRLTLNSRTPEKIELDPSSLALNTKHKLYVNAQIV